MRCLATLLRALALCAAARGAASVPVRRSLFGMHRAPRHEGWNEPSSPGTMVYHLDDDTATCGDTKLTSGYMTSEERRDLFVRKAVAYMTDREDLSLATGDCRSRGYTVAAGEREYRFSYHIYTVKIWSKPSTAAPTTPTPTAAPTTATPTTASPTHAIVAPAGSRAMSVTGVVAAMAPLSTLARLVTAAGYAKLLSNSALRLTLFAPTDAAFAALGARTLARLLLPRNKDKLQQVLRYHVHVGAVPMRASLLHDGASLTTLEGRALHVDADADTGRVEIIGGTAADVATVAKADVFASNGVVHVIDRVLLPPDFFLHETSVPTAPPAATSAARAH